MNDATMIYATVLWFHWSRMIECHISMIYAAPLRIRNNSKPLSKSHMPASFHASLFQNGLDLSRWTFLLVLMHLPARHAFNECQLPAANCIYMTYQRLASCIVSGESFLCRFMGCTLLAYPSHRFPLHQRIAISSGQTCYFWLSVAFIITYH